MGCNKRTYYREVHSDTGHLKELEIEEQTKAKVSRRNHWDLAEINRDKENNCKDQWN